ncbi:MAG TPA: hypothetical protein DD621_05550 [Clostridiales bacterium]|nr:hypothetical protein [Clostridiales bacterium]
MSTVIYYSISLVTAVVFGLGYFFWGRKSEKNQNLFFKILSSALAILFVFRYMSGEDLIESTLRLDFAEIGSHGLTFMSLIVNWFIIGMELILMLFPFFDKNYTKDVIRFFVLPFSIIALGFMPFAMQGIVGMSGYNSLHFRAIIMAVEFAITFGYSFVVFWDFGKFKTQKKDALKLLYVVPLMLLAVMPCYTIKGIFGYANIAVKIKGLNFYHRMIIYFSLILPVVLYFLLRKKDKEFKRLCLLYISIGTLISFSIYHKFASFLDVTAWPFHLCNTAMYIMVLCLLFKWDSLFYFSLFINVLGAFFAMAMPNYSSELNLFSSRLVEFYINHYIAFFMPILIVALRVYPRPKLKQFMYSIAGFAGYFLLALFINSWFTGLIEAGILTGKVDYFFINSNFIADKLGAWAERLRDVVTVFNIGGINFTLYPVYQILFFLVYVALGAGMWFLYEWAYQSADLLYEIADRKAKMKMDEQLLKVALNGRGADEPMNEKNKNKLVIENFTKRYGNSKVYAVKDANLTINGGDIFGFLGPNGAGKSTIIKSIVGIQPISSGSISVCGYDVDKQSVMAKRQIGFVPDHYALYEKLTGREYINYIADLYDVSTADRNKALDKYIKLFQLENAIDNPIRTYSHGMKQKITIMSALVHNPKVWILDEPLTGLDPNSIYQVKECMKAHAKAGNIVFFSSHIIDVVESICDRIAIIKKGQILTVKTMQEIEEECGLEQFYLKTIDPNGYEKLEQKIEQKIEEKENETSPEQYEKMTAESVSEKKAKIESQLDSETQPVKNNKKVKGN